MVSFLREGTDKLGFAKLRNKPDKGRLGHNKQRKEHVLWGTLEEFSTVGIESGKDA